MIGYYTLSNASVTLSELPEVVAKKRPAYPVPAIRIGRFAVDLEFHRQGVGEELLMNALRQVVDASEVSASFAVLVEAKEQSIGFYKKYGFISLKQSPKTLFLPTKTIIEAIGSR